MKKYNKNVLIIISIVSLCAIILGFVILNLYNNHNNQNISETGHFYGTPSSVEDIDFIEVVYNDGNDYVFITDDLIKYYSYDDKGNFGITNYIEDVDFITELTKYIYSNDLKYLKEYNKLKDAKWSLEIDSPGKSCLISGTNNPPLWFKKLLDKLNVKEYGYTSK